MKTEENIDDNLLTKTNNSKKQNFDLSEITGGDGFWQRRILIIVVFLQVPCAFNVYSMSFLAPNLDHWCVRPPEARSLSVEEWRRLAIPSSDKYCSRYMHINLTRSQEDINGQPTVPCEAWEYDKTFYHSTVLSQFNLVCDRKWLVSLSKSVYVIGMTFSLILFSHLSDRIGRKSVIIVSGIITIFSALISSFSTTFITFLAARFFIAFGVTVFMITPFILLMEVVAPKYRNVYGIIVQIGWTLGILTLPLIAWLLRDSVWIQMAITSPCLILLTIGWIPESPRWLLNHGKVEEVKQLLFKAAKTNGLEPSEEDKEALDVLLSKGTESYNAGESQGNVFNLLKTPGLRGITLNVYFSWFVITFVYYGLSINTNELAGDPFINFALVGAVEIPATLFSILLVGPVGKKKLMAIFMMISGVACFASYLISSNHWWVIVTLSSIGKFAISAAFILVYIFTSEVFPTVVRNSGLGSASLCGRLGAVTAPFMREVGFATHPIFPQIIFGVLAVASGLLIIRLPETKNLSVPDTIEEAAQLSKRKNVHLPKDVKENCIMVKLTEVESNNEQEDRNLLTAKVTSSV